MGVVLHSVRNIDLGLVRVRVGLRVRVRVRVGLRVRVRARVGLRVRVRVVRLTVSWQPGVPCFL